MIRLAHILLGGACLLGSAPVAAPAGDGGPPLGGPFYSTGNGGIGTPDEIVAFAAKGTRQRSGRYATMTTLVFRVHALQAGPYAVGRFDAATEYDCDAGSWRARQIVARDMDNRLVQTLPPENTGFSRPNPNDRKTTAEIAMACFNQLPPPGTPMVLTITDVERMMNRYRGQGRGSYEMR